MIAVLKITKAHGIQGAVRVLFYNTFEYNNVHLIDEHGRAFVINTLKDVSDTQGIITFEGITNRNQAEELIGLQLYQEGATLSENEFYESQLLEQKIHIDQEDSSEYCTIQSIVNYGAGDIFELLHEGKSFMIPFKSEYFTEKLVLTSEHLELFKNIADK